MRKLKPEDHSGYKLNLTEYVRVLWRKKHLIAIPLFFAMLVAYVGSRFLLPVYESSVVLRIENPGMVTQEVQRLVQGGGGQRLQDSEMSARVKADLTSGPFLDQLSRFLGFDRDPNVIRKAEATKQTLYPEMTIEDLVMRRLRATLRGRIDVRRAGPGLFEVAYMDANPEACYIIADAISKLYIEEQQKSKILGLREVSDFSDEQLAVYKERLQRSEGELERFEQNMTRTSASANPVGESNVGLAESLQRQLEVEVEDRRSIVEKLKGQIEQHIGRTFNTDRFLEDRQVQSLRSELVNDLEAALILQLKGSVSAPRTGATDTGQGNVQQEIMNGLGELVHRVGELIRVDYPNIDPDYRPLINEYVYQSVQLGARETTLTLLRRYIDSFRTQLERSPKMNTELQRLRSEVQSNRNLYDSFLQAKTSTQISEAAQNTKLGANMEVVETATFPLEPVKPNKLKILALAFMFGLMLGGGGLLLSEFTDSSFKTVEDVERRLEIKVIGTIPKVEQGGVVWRRKNRAKQVAIWATTCIVLTTASIFAFYFYGKSTKENLITFQMHKTENTRGQ